MELSGSSAVVTGGGSGLGAATAKLLAESGARVTILDLNEAAARSQAEAIGGAAVACDVCDEQSTTEALDRAVELHGEIRILVHCAGISEPARIVGRKGPQPLKDFAKSIQVNLVGTYNVMRLTAARMQANTPWGDDRERGVIVNTGSVAAFEGQVGQASYAASKAGVVALTLPAAREFASSGIRVLCIAPGIFSTPLMDVLPQEVQDSLGASIPFPSRLGAPSEFAELAVHMIQNRMLNGEVVRLDGAIRMAAR